MTYTTVVAMRIFELNGGTILIRGRQQLTRKSSERLRLSRSKRKMRVGRLFYVQVLGGKDGVGCGKESVGREETH